MALSAEEQYFLELVNRARLDPAAEATRLGIPLGEGGVVIAPGIKQALAPNARLERAADGHAAWMFANDTFAHEGQGGSSKNDRAADAGYYGLLGENLSLLDARFGSGETLVNAHHRQLWDSAKHRPTMLNDDRREVGISIESGSYSGTSATIGSQLFGTDRAYFVTGVVYNDRNGNGFYNIGEGSQGVRFTSGRSSDTSEAAGGYGIAVAGRADTQVEVQIGRRSVDLTVDTRGSNVKIDVIGGDRLDIAGSFDLLSQAPEVRMLGAGGYSAHGSEVGDVMTGNRGANLLAGEAGFDRLGGGGGNDTVVGGAGNDRLGGGDGNDRLQGDRGTDRLYGNDGNDRLAGGQGDDTLTGGRGADSFIFGRGMGRDVVADFAAREGDRIVLDDAMWRGAKSAQQVVEDHASVGRGGFVVLDFGASGMVELRGITSTRGLADLIDII